MNIATHDGVDVEWFLFGTEGPVVVLAAGNGRPASDLSPLAERLAAAGMRAVTYNYRSIGASTGTLEGITLHDHADDLWSVVDALDEPRVHLVGKTFGNRVVRCASSDRPERVERIVLVGAGGEVPPSPDTQALYARMMDPTIPHEEWAALQLELNFAPGNEHLAAALVDGPRWPELTAAQVQASLRTPGEEWWSGGTAPMLVVCGLQDRVAVPANGLGIAERRPGTWLVGIPQCGHNMIFEQPDAISSLVHRFLATGTVLT